MSDASQPIGRLGRHVPIPAGLVRAIAYARETGHETAQVFPGNPTGWRHVPLSPEAAEAVRAEALACDEWPLAIHAQHIINLATPDDDLAQKSILAVANALDRGREIGAAYVIVHAGSHKGSGEDAGIARVAGAVEGLLATAPAGVQLLIENSAGAGNILAGSPEALGRMLATLPPEVGVCVDTAHLWGAGIDISTRDGVEAALESLDRWVGLERIKVVHLNDSAAVLGSHRDLHAHLGEGAIGLKGLASWMGHPGLRGRPIILETPVEDTAERETARCAIARLLRDGDVEMAEQHLLALQNQSTNETQAPDL